MKGREMDHAEFQLSGNVGRIDEVGTTLKVRIASEYGKKDDTGEFVENPFWNQITIFNERTIKWVLENTKIGDKVFCRGTVRETKYEKEGQKKYDVTLAATEFSNVSFAENRRQSR